MVNGLAGRAGPTGLPEPTALPEAGRPTVGVLALQGDVAEHVRALRASGAEPAAVRRPEELDRVDGLVIPGGESTTIWKLIDIFGLAEPLRKRIADGMPVFGSCAGLIMLDRDHLGILDITARRNAFGRQLASFEAELPFDGLSGGPVHAVFIRAPWIEQHGPNVEVLARVDGHPVAVRQDRIIATAFHPELSGETRLHELLLAPLAGAR